MFGFFGGAPKLLVPDNLKSCVKAKVEAGVGFAQSYIRGRRRRLTFFSLAKCNAAISLDAAHE